MCIYIYVYIHICVLECLVNTFKINELKIKHNINNI